MTHILTIGFLTGLLVATLRTATPLILCGIGVVFAERGGVLDLSVEASMLMGAFASFMAAYYSGSILLGLAAGIAAGLFVGYIMAFFSVTLMASQVATGTVLTIFALGATSFGFDLIMGVTGAAPQVTILPALPIPGLSGLPVLGPVLFDQNALVYLALLLGLVGAPILYRTPWGLKLRACGEDHRAAVATGIDVQAMRYHVILLCGALSGLGGASLTLGQLGFFAENMTAGKGFIAIAAVVFGRWNPWKTMLAALFFGLADALQVRLQVQGIAVPHQLLLVLPYALTIVALVAGVRSRGDVGTPAGPRELGVPYEPESA
jgi:general nucleoside transport system permease protein